MLTSSVVGNRATQRVLLGVALVVVGVLVGLGLGALPLTYAVIFILGLCAVAGILIDPFIGLTAALFLGPLQAWLMVQPSPIPASIGQYTLVIFLALWFADVVLRRRMHFTLPPLFGSLFAFLFVAGLSLWHPVDIWQGFTELAKWVQMALIYLIVYDRLVEKNNPTQLALMVGMLAGSGLLQTAFGIWQFALRGDGPETFAISARFYRAYGTFMQPNPYAGFVAMVAALMLGMSFVLGVNYIKTHVFKRGQNEKVRGLWYFVVVSCAAVLAIGLVASWSRGGWLGFGAAVLAMLFFTPDKWQHGLLLVLGLLVVGALLYSAGYLPANITERLASFLDYTRFTELRSVGITDANFSTLERMAHWHAALEMWRSRLWFGVGLGNYASAYPGVNLPNWVLPLGHAHNIYLNMLAETGLSGLCAYLLFLLSLFYKLARASRRVTGWQRGLAVGLLGVWTHMAVHNMVDNLMVNNVHLHMGVMLALSAWVITTVESRVPIGSS